MTDRETRIEALKLAIKYAEVIKSGTDTRGIVAMAQKFEEYLVYGRTGR